MKKTGGEDKIKAELRELTDRVRGLNRELRALTAHNRRPTDAPKPDHQWRLRVRGKSRAE